MSGTHPSSSFVQSSNWVDNCLSKLFSSPSSLSAMDACLLKVTQKAKKEVYSDSGISFRSSKRFDSSEEHNVRDVSLDKSNTEEQSDGQLFPLRPPPRLQNAVYSNSNPSHHLRSSPSVRYGLSLRLRLRSKDFDPFMAAFERVQKEEEDDTKDPSSWTRSLSSSFRWINEPSKVVSQKFVAEPASSTQSPSDPENGRPGIQKAKKENDSDFDEFEFELRVGEESFCTGEARPLKPPPPLQCANYGRSRSSCFRSSGKFLGIKFRSENSEVDPFMAALEHVRREARERDRPAASERDRVRPARSFRWGTEPATKASQKKREVESVESGKSFIVGASYCTWHAGRRGSASDERSRIHKGKDVGPRGFGYLLIQFHGFFK